MKKRCDGRNLIMIVGFLLTCFFPVTFANAKTVYYCEVLEAIFIRDHQAARAQDVGEKFKMEVVAPRTFPGGSLRFSEGSPIGGDFHIVDSQGGVDRKFLAHHPDRGTHVLHFFEGHLTFVDIADLSDFGGPILGVTKSAKCDKF